MNRCSSGGTVWLVNWPPIHAVSSVITTVRPFRHAASAAAHPPAPAPTITTSAASSRGICHHLLEEARVHHGRGCLAPRGLADDPEAEDPVFDRDAAAAAMD